jgi:hypothetical protein
MAEYRIVAKVDPQTAAGSNKVKQDLRGIQNEARATETALNRSFDQAKFDKTIGGLVNRINQLDGSIKGLTSGNAALTRSNETLGQSLDRMAASQGKANAQTNMGAKAVGDATSKNAQYEAALMRVLRATDQEAAEQARLNALLADAKRLLDAGVISQERYAQVQQMATQAAQQQAVVTGSQRIGMQQLGFQLGDIATMYSLGAKPAQIFASQIGQVTQALQLMSNGSNRFLTLMGGPWGVAISVAAIVLTPLIAKLFEGNDALGESIDKMKKDAAETELNRKAKEAFARTMEGVTQAIRDQNKELKESLQTQRDVLVEGAKEQRLNLERLKQRREDAKLAIETAKVEADAASRRAAETAGTHFGDAARQAAERAAAKVKELEAAYAATAKSVQTAEENIRRADAALAKDSAQTYADPIRKINAEYEKLAQQAIEAAVASKNYNQEALTQELLLLEQRKKKAIEAAQAQDRLNKSTDAGAATFKSRRQALGIAGRELQQQGYRVNEGLDFGGITPGAHKSSHVNAIDVNVGKGVVEANVPDLRAKFDAAARRYQSRGFTVLWNGWVYVAGGNGPTKRIAAGQDQHHDHMHLQAPATIVGKATQSSTEAQYNREENASQRVAERAEDFVGAVVARQAQVGLPAGRQTQLNAAIDEALGEFRRRFDREATTGEEATIRKAFTDADVRETAQRFEDAYVKPLQRLKALQGQTGIDREIMNAKLEETLRLERELTPVEEAQIENGIREGDLLERKAALLQEIRAPMEAYSKQMEVLNALLADGDISLASYNSRLAEMAAGAASKISGLPGVDPGTGMAYQDIGAVADENARYAKELEDFSIYREQLLQMGVDYDALELQARQQHLMNLDAIETARKDVQLASAEAIWGSMATIFEQGLGKQSALYKAAFATEKAAAIARSIIAIQTGIAQASSLPFPANLGAMATVAAQTASIISNIRAVTLAFKDGGLVQGPGGPRSDSVNARLSNGEFVVNAAATANNRPLLEAINSGQQVRQATAAQAVANGGGAGQVVVQPNPAPQVHIRQVNVTDPRMVADFFATPEGEQVFVNMVNANPEVVKQAANN